MGVICNDNVSVCVEPYLLSAPALRRCPTGSAYIDPVAGLEEEEKGNVKQIWFNQHLLFACTCIKNQRARKRETDLHPVSFSLLMALESSRMQPRKPAPCRLWIFLWFHILMVMESVFPM